MECHDDRRWKIGWKILEKRNQRLNSARGSSYNYNVKGSIRRSGRNVRQPSGIASEQHTTILIICTLSYILWGDVDSVRI